MRHLRGFFDDPAAASAHQALMRRVFGVAPDKSLGRWCPFGLFDASGACVAGLAARCLPLAVGGTVANLGGLRRVAVDPAWRGRGLMRALVTDALEWCDANGLAPVLLFAETPALYTGLGFAPVAQHAFVGAPPIATGTTPTVARRLDPRSDEDRALLSRRLAGRAPVSSRGGLAGAADLVLANLSDRPDLVARDLADLDATIVLDDEAAELTIVDVLAPVLPSLSAILGALGAAPACLTTLFSPDRLDWVATPQREDTGLMAHGPLPSALRQPFMLPPTAEF